MYELLIGMEVHAELRTRSKMFCGCAVIDPTSSSPNTAVCPVCMGLPGALPVLNCRAVELGIRTALALGCSVHPVSIFARKNYFYPDLPKGYQISQYEEPLATAGMLILDHLTVEKTVRIRRVHLEEDTGKLSHTHDEQGAASLVDLNRAGVPLLEIVTEPDMHSAEEAVAFCRTLRSILRTLEVSLGDMEKGMLRFEANVSLHRVGEEMGTKVEIKNLNSFKAIEHAIEYEFERQKTILEGGSKVAQETVGWEDLKGVTFTQRSKEEAHDYRYFPEPDLPPLVIQGQWIDCVRAELPELPRQKALRFIEEYKLRQADAHILAEDALIADYFENTLKHLAGCDARTAAAWITGELFAWMNQSTETIERIKVKPEMLAELLGEVSRGAINAQSAKAILADMLRTGAWAKDLIRSKGLEQISDSESITQLMRQIMRENAAEVQAYREGKTTLDNWFFGQVMKATGGKANPQVVRQVVGKELTADIGDA